jgi:DNA-directed RNA polymerase subunit F
LQKDLFDEIIKLGPEASPLAPELAKMKATRVLAAIGPAAKDAIPDMLAALPKFDTYKRELSADRAMEVMDDIAKVDPQAPKKAVPPLVVEFHKMDHVYKSHVPLLQRMMDLDREKTKELAPDFVRWLSAKTLFDDAVAHLELLAKLDQDTARKVTIELNRRLAAGSLYWATDTRERLARVSADLGVSSKDIPSKDK